MNNYPNYMAGGRFQPMMQPYNYQPMAQVPQYPVQPIGGGQNVPQIVEPAIDYDFYGVQVKSFEEAQKYPYCCEKPLFLLDAQNEKVYIKKIENGIPSVTSFDLKEIKENSVQTNEIKKEQKEEVKEPQFDFKSEFSNMKQEIIQTLQQDFQKQFNELKTTRENENRGNKKW